MGNDGAAVATVIGQVVTAIFAIWYLCHTKVVKVSKTDFKFERRIINKTLVLGICSFLSQISLVAAMAAINNMLRKYGAMDEIFGQPQYAQIPMAVVGIVMKFFQIVISRSESVFSELLMKVHTIRILPSNHSVFIFA